MIKSTGKYFCLLMSVFLLNACKSYGQMDSINNLNEYKFNQPVISAVGFNILYLGIENPVAIAIPKLPSETIHAQVSTNGTISGREGLYTIFPIKGNKLELAIYSVSGKDSTYYGQFQFKVLELPDPVAYVAGISDSSIVSKWEIINTGGVLVKFKNIPFLLKSEIVSFEVSASKEGQDVLLKSDRALYTQEMINLFKSANKDAIFIFQNIRVAFPDKSERLLTQSIKLKIS